MVGRHRHTAYQKFRVNDTVIQLYHRIHDHPGGRSPAFQIDRAMSVFGNPSAIAVHRYFTFIAVFDLRIQKIFNIISHCQYHLIRHQPLFHQIKNQ